MSDGGEKTCPLCAEEMDLTDQQLKPCKCGYDICVWCWHHIMDMAEKDYTEGRCPACRSAYNKEKIVGTAASRGSRLVSEMNVEKKVKSQKGKNKTSEGRKQLATVRVIQRNLVYVVGLPLDFADEDLLQRREYFGQYGKVMKVSISRTAGGAIQQFANSTCSVYITYSKEEEAVRSIQSVHGFVLDGRPLRACFGTTKYCHAWLRNVPCSNPDCLYLHEIGSHEDSFTKDEIISAYTRSRVQQFTGPSNSMQRRSGNVLPPPLDEYCASSVMPTAKTAVNTNNSAVIARFSPPNSGSGRSAALPAGASWGTRSLNNQPSHTSTPYSNGPIKQKSDLCNGAVACSTAVASPNQVSSLHSNSGKMLIPNAESTISEDKMESLEPMKNEYNRERRIYVSESSFASINSATLPINRQTSDAPTTKLPSNSNNVVDSPTTSSNPALDRDSLDAPNGNIENVCSDILSMSIHPNQQLENGYVEHNRETPTSQTCAKAADPAEEVRVTNVQSDFGLGTPTQVTQADLHEPEDDLLSFDNQRLKDPEVSINRIPDHSHGFNRSKHSTLSSQFNNVDLPIRVDFDRDVVNRNSNLVVSTSSFPTERPQDVLNSSEVNDVEYSNLFPSKERMSLLGRNDSQASSGASNMGESSIISNILSMDFDPWDESLTSPQNLSNLLGETERRRGTFGVPGPRKSQNSNQSRFSFAREEEPMSQISDFGQSFDYFDEGFKHRPSQDFGNSNGLHIEKFASLNGFPVFNGTESDVFANNHSHISSNKLSISRSQISAPPPGFSVPNRAPPPGFTSHERTEQIFDTLSGNHRLDSSSFLRSQYQTSSSGNTISNGDIEFMDPAILAVGKGTLPGGSNTPGLDIRSNFSPQLSPYEESRFQSFLQRSLPPHQNQRYNDPLDSFAPLGDAYGISSRVMEQTLNNNISPYSQFNLRQHRNGITSNGQWDGWNEGQNGNNFGVAELLRNDRLGYNNFYGGYEDSKIRMPSSGNLYNGTYGI